MRSLPTGLLIAMLLGAAAQAETSSWSSQGEAGKKAAGAAKGAKPGPPQKGPAAAPPPNSASPANDGVSSHAKGAAQDEDAAYEAFDQGRYLTALDLAVKAAEKGDPQAHTLVGRIYGEGYGVAKNSALAANWYARGAELGDPEAMFAYAMMLADGQGVEKDYDAAVPQGRGQTGKSLPRLHAHAVRGRSRGERGAIRPRHALCDRHRR